MKTHLLILTIFCFIFCFHNNLLSQNKDKAVFKKFDPSKSFYYNEILPDVESFGKNTIKKPYLMLEVKHNKKDFPVNIDEYTKVWHNTPVSQGNTGTCWCYSATSFMESEVKRLYDKEVKLSEMYTVYWEYVERAADFVKTRGKTYYNEGSEANAIPKIWKKYGIVPLNAYPGKEKGRKYHSHQTMIKELKHFLEHIKENGTWNETHVVNTVKSILEKYMGTPPKKFIVEGKKYTPETYLNDYLKLNMNDYFSFMSLKKNTYYQKHELIEDDNWWHDNNYYNIPLDTYMNLIKQTIKNGYSISICGDISEPGCNSETEISIIPTFDIPSEYIDEDSRQYRLSAKVTTDDHCVHIVGYTIIDETWWFLMKDSGASGFNGVHKGYCFYHEDYIKLKMMNILIHKDTAKKILDKIIK